MHKGECANGLRRRGIRLERKAREIAELCTAESIEWMESARLSSASDRTGVYSCIATSLTYISPVQTGTCSDSHPV